MGFFNSFTCPVCNKTFSFLRKTITQINGEYLCGDCAKKRGRDLLQMSKGMEDYENKLRQFDNKIFENKKNLLERKKMFNPSVSINDIIYFDDENKLFSFPEKSRMINVYNIISYDELISYDVIENGATVTSGGLGEALLGGAFFGLAGAIAGGTSKRIDDLCSTLQLKITTSNEVTPVIYIDFLKSETPKNSSVYKEKSRDIQNILSKFEIITNGNSDFNKEKDNKFSAADEIKKYKELLDMGAITEEEYEKKKKQLLEN